MIESQPNHDPHYTGTFYANNVQGSRRETGSQINKGEKCAKYIRGGYIQQRLNEFNIEAMRAESSSGERAERSKDRRISLPHRNTCGKV